MELQNTQLTTQTNNQNQITELVEKVATLEVDSAKYDSDVVGCYATVVYDTTMKIYPNGVGVVDWFENRIDQVFTWEVKGDYIQFNFGTNMYNCFFYEKTGNSYLYRGTQLAQITEVFNPYIQKYFTQLKGLQVLVGEDYRCENITAVDIIFGVCD